MRNILCVVNLKNTAMSEELNPEVLGQPVESAESVVEATQEQTVAAEPVAQEPADQEPVAVEPVSEENVEQAEAEEPAAEETPEQPVQKAAKPANLSEKSLAELIELFKEFMSDVERVKNSKEADAIKSAFYRKLSKEKAEAGYGEKVDEPSSKEYAEIEVEPVPADESPEKVNPFEALENGFKSLYAEYRKERSELNRESEQQKAENLVLKQAVIDDLRSLVESQEDVSASFPEFRSIQDRWRSIGQVPIQNFRDINSSYQFLVEKFYDKVKINHELRDLDFKKNLEAKEKFCEMAENLSENPNVIEAFAELQKLHEQWKEYGPVAKELRDSIWERFRAATSVINKKYQSHFEEQKAKQNENLAAKSGLCEQVEKIAEQEIKGSNEWNSCTKQIEEIQKQWRTIGFASKKENQKIYDRFRAACDKFFERKRSFYSEYKSVMDENYDKKMALIEQAEALKSSTEWKKAAEQFINLQKQWKEIGAVPRKKSEALWKRFRAACDEFFEARDSQAKPEKNDYYGNLKAKKKLIEEINAYVPVEDDDQANEAAFKEFSEKWNALGFVPFKEKDAIQQAYREAVDAKFPGRSSQRSAYRGGYQQQPRGPKTAKDRLVQKFNTLQQDIQTYENNLGFFTMSKNSESLIAEMKKRIESAKEELAALKEQIRAEEEKEEGKQ